ncbi:uncharacterized protein TrAFT101_007572 [Trichoderma asperellum]|nr:hypothetical protein TrAFT101_007572 [Trichoderma asperellum]
MMQKPLDAARQATPFLFFTPRDHQKNQPQTMSSFFVELWEGIFTPGPTPTILKATNATFAALQVVLLSLLFATYSVHFVVLSVLCGGLWWSINWFARELKVAQAAEAERQRKEEEKKKQQQRLQGGGDGSGSSDTEVEGKVARRTTRSSSSKKSGGAAAVKADAEPLEKKGEVKQRAVLEPQSSASTEDEWERVSESER